MKVSEIKHLITTAADLSFTQRIEFTQILAETEN